MDKWFHVSLQSFHCILLQTASPARALCKGGSAERMFLGLRVSLPGGLFLISNFRVMLWNAGWTWSLLSGRSLMSTFVAYHFSYILFCIHAISGYLCLHKANKKKVWFLSYKKRNEAWLGFLTLGGWGQPWHASAHASVPRSDFIWASCINWTPIFSCIKWYNNNTCLRGLF